MFIDRTAELGAITKRLDSDKFELIVIYGRRRIGKSALVFQAIKERAGYTYFLATERGNLEDFMNAAKANLPGIERLKGSWENYLDALKGGVIAIDEFPNLITEDKNVVNLLQRAVDTNLSSSKTKLILLGSSISMMEKRVLSQKSPLYGRRTSALKLGQLDIFESQKFFAGSSLEEMVEIYGFCGGVPYYLEKVRRPFWKWLASEILESDTFIKTEMDFLLKYEFEDIGTYKKILEAIALGKTKLNEIKDYVKAKGEITSYLSNLISVEIVEKKTPILESPKSKKGRYYLKDNFSRFWFRFVAPNLSAIEARNFDIDGIKREYANYSGKTFEDLGESLLLRLLKKGRIFGFSKAGKYWGRRPDRESGENSFDIDLVALNEETKEIAFFEIKFSSVDKKQADSILSGLKAKASFLGWHNEERKEYFGIIAKKIECKAECLKEGYLAFDLEDFSEG